MKLLCYILGGVQNMTIIFGIIIVLVIAAIIGVCIGMSNRK